MTLRSRLSFRSVLRLPLLGVLACLVPVAALANSCPSASSTTCFINEDGNGSASGTGIGSTFSLSNSALTQIGWKSGSLGHLTFSTGAMTSGSWQTSATFSSIGSSFVLKGTYNNISNGIIFSGAFTGPITWAVVGTCTAGQVCTYDLSGTISGTWFANGAGSTTGATVQLYFQSNGPYKGGTQTISDLGGVSYVNTPTVTAEPASLLLMGSGLLGVGFIARRKVKGQP